MKNRLLQTLLLFALFLPALAHAAENPSREQPNIVLISIDTLRADHVGAYGYYRNTTPNIDALAARGVLFENAISQAPWTLPSHVSIFTSLNPDEHGSTELNLSSPSNTSGISGNLTTIAEALQRQGYATAGFASFNFFNFKGFEKGFGDYRVFSSYEEDARGEEEKYGKFFEAVSAWLNRTSGKKFFLFLHYFAPHGPYSPPAEFRGFADPDYSGDFNDSYGLSADSGPDPAAPKKVSTKEDIAYAEALYDGEIGFTDAQVGLVLERLRALGLENTTLVVLLSDHGEAFGEHGQFYHKELYDENVRVPLVISGPAFPASGAKISAQARLIDVAPTILDAAGVSIPAQFKGRSLMGLVRGEGGAELSAYSETRHMAEIYSIRTGAFKAIRRVEHGGEKSEYYDLANDPKELKNLALQHAGLQSLQKAQAKPAEREISLAGLFAKEASDAGFLSVSLVLVVSALGAMRLRRRFAAKGG
ncbi:MAG: sulfatase [Candidatus Micrarchaeia archaeon]|jgi:arylsulfatase A-like enzyme